MDGSTILIGSVLMLALIGVPGLAITLALFPKWRQITPVERLGLAFVFGMIPQTILYFANKNLGIEITAMTTLLAILLVAGIGAMTYFVRKPVAA